MSDVAGRRLAYAALLLLYLLHNDLWYWDDPRVVMGLPVGLTYHVGLSVAASLVMLLMVRFAWPHELEVLEGMPPAGAAASRGHAVPETSRGAGGRSPEGSGEPR